MFAGKTEELIRRVRRLEHAVPSVCVSVHKPSRDTRSDSMKTHYGDGVSCTPLENLNPLDIDDGDWVIIDEFQFAGKEWAQIVVEMSLLGINVIVAGLPIDSRGQPFGPMPTVLPFADKITSLTALCKKCGSDATKTQRLEDIGDTVMVGGTEMYEARCNKCWEPR